MTSLVFHHGALGDGVLLWPVLRSLQRLGEVALIAPRDRARLAARWLGVEPIDIDAPDFARLHGPSADASGELQARLAGADLIVSFISDGADRWSANVEAIAPGCQCIYCGEGDDASLHIADQHAACFAAAGHSIANVPVDVRRNHDGPVVLHPGSGGAAKCWPAERFETLADHLQAMGRPVEVLLGEAEAERWPGERLEHWAERFDLHWPGDLVGLSERIARAAAFVGNDSGPTHLAAQLGVPTIALFGPTDVRRWAPRGPVVRIFAPPQPTTMDWLAVESVAEALARW